MVNTDASNCKEMLKATNQIAKNCLLFTMYYAFLLTPQYEWQPYKTVHFLAIQYWQSKRFFYSK